MKTSPRSLIAVLGFGLLLAETAFAGIGEVKPRHFTCDAPGGHFATEDVSRYASDNTLAARVSYRDSHKNNRWGTTAGLLFVFPDQSTAGAFVQADHGTRQLVIGLKKPNDSENYEIARVPIDQVAEVVVRVDEQNTLLVASGGSFSRLKLRKRGESRLNVMCSSGQFDIFVVPAEVRS